MRIAGIKSWVRWSAWFIYSIIPTIVSVFLIVTLLKFDFFHVGYAPIEFSNFMILATFLILYCITITIKCFLLSTLFHKPCIAIMVGVVVWIFSYFIPKYIIDTTCNIPFSMHLCIMLLPNMALHYGFSAIAQYEIRELGVQWSNWHLPAGESSEEITMFQTCAMLVFDSIIYFFLTLYLDAIIPGKYGISQPKDFPLKFIKSCFTRRRNITENVELGEALIGKEKYAINLLDVSKKYGQRTVVNELNMTVNMNQITVLLGHNGAGKSTIMNIITGIIEKTEGRMYINNKEICKTSDITQSIGVCPQHNLFFWNLTVLQHLIFFAMVKGVSYTDAQSEINYLLKTLNLQDKKYECPLTLSGGMQRKLCLAMAVIGDPDILILDEPSSGMDPQSRREMWDLLLQWRKHKTILITTHFMEEADALADQVIIINEGRAKCSGTPMQLKLKYGCGATVTLLIEDNENVEATAKIIENSSGNLVLKRIDGNEIQFTIKEGSNVELFKHLEKYKEALKIVNISYRNTNLEDVFVNTISKTDQNDMSDKIKDFIKPTQNKTLWLILKSLFFKRWNFTCSQIVFYIFSVMMVLWMILICVVLGQNYENLNKGGQAINLSLRTYRNSTVFMHSNQREEHFQIRKYYDDIVKNDGSILVEHEDVLGAIIDEGIRNLPCYRRHRIAAAEFSNIGPSQPIEAVALYNNLAIHSAPISVNLITNTIAKHLLGQNYSIAISIHPLENIHSKTTNELSESRIGLLWLIIMPTGYLFLLGSFIYFPFMELSTKFARIQFMCGVSPGVYWIFMFTFDLILYLGIVLITLTPMILWSPFQNMKEIGSLYVILAFYGICGIPFSYLYSRKKTFSSAHAHFVINSLVSGILIGIIVFALRESGKNHLKKIGDVIWDIFIVISPQFGLTYCGFTFSMKVIRNYNFKVMSDIKRLSVCSSNNPPACCNEKTPECDLESNYLINLGPSMGLMGIGALIFLVLNIVMDCDAYSTPIKLWNHCRSYERSSDEEEALNNNKSHSLRVTNLSKRYGKIEVVKEIELTMSKGKCMGILGVNGAGKSTTFRMLTREEAKLKGTIKIDNINIDKNEYIEKLGYCPQNNALNMLLTGRQILTTIALLRGISDDTIVEYLIDIIGIKDIADSPCHQYSGGNKRKLSFAVAIIGFPEFNLLDEPTNGVDPLSRRTFWTFINYIKNKYNTSIILASHSMDECEALCNNINIMKKGEIVEKGSISELKNKAVGFNVKIKLKDCSDEKVEALKERIEEEFGIFDIIDEHLGLLHLLIKPKQKQWAHMFETFDRFKFEKDSLVEHYEISDASLEQIFLATANDGGEKKFRD
ncbi:ATP-binding cassette sub-family A member 17-like isoform X2 [Euwallacea fornicatus]